MRKGKAKQAILVPLALCRMYVLYAHLYMKTVLAEIDMLLAFMFPSSIGSVVIIYTVCRDEIMITKMIRNTHGAVAVSRPSTQ